MPRISLTPLGSNSNILRTYDKINLHNIYDHQIHDSNFGYIEREEHWSIAVWLEFNNNMFGRMSL